jgi:hypothetical protein
LEKVDLDLKKAAYLAEAIVSNIYNVCKIIDLS